MSLRNTDFLTQIKDKIEEQGEAWTDYMKSTNERFGRLAERFDAFEDRIEDREARGRTPGKSVELSTMAREWAELFGKALRYGHRDPNHDLKLHNFQAERLQVKD